MITTKTSVLMFQNALHLILKSFNISHPSNKKQTRRITIPRQNFYVSIYLGTNL